MEDYKYNVEVLELREVHELPGAWTEEHFRNLLSLIEYEDAGAIPDEELKEMAAMALSDLEAEEAARLVLELRFGGRLNKGQRQNLSEEMKDERIWEEYAEISCHEELFNAACMLYWAFPKTFPEPDAIKIKLKISALHEKWRSDLKAPTAAFLARLLNDGMERSNTIYRLFDENIESDHFPDSEHVIWKFISSGNPETENTLTVDLYTSWNWVDELKGVRSYESSAYADGRK